MGISDWGSDGCSSDLGLLQGRVEQAARSAGLDPEARRFVPHVTLARFAGGAVAEEAVTRWMTLNSPFAAGPFPVREAVLFESFPGRDGPHYDPRLAVPLARLPDADYWPAAEWMGEESTERTLAPTSASTRPVQKASNRSKAR